MTKKTVNDMSVSEVLKQFQTVDQPEPVTEAESRATELQEIGTAVYATDDGVHPERIDARTDYDANLARVIARARTFAKRYKCSFVDDVCNNVGITRLSLNRGSRKEYKEIAQSSQGFNPFPQQAPTPTIKTRLLGGE
jgi:hypothetical protein